MWFIFFLVNLEHAGIHRLGLFSMRTWTLTSKVSRIGGSHPDLDAQQCFQVLVENRFFLFLG